jgi:hypothetical protein
MAAFERTEVRVGLRIPASSLRAKRSNPQRREAANWIASSLTLLAMTKDAMMTARQKEGPHRAGLRMIGWSTDPKSDQAVLL